MAKADTHPSSSEAYSLAEQGDKKQQISEPCGMTEHNVYIRGKQSKVWELGSDVSQLSSTVNTTHHSPLRRRKSLLWLTAS